MLYETLNHPSLLLLFIGTGIAGGSVFDVGNYVKFLLSYKNISNIIIDFLETSLCLFMLFFVNLKYNYGQLRLFPLLIFLIVFSLERITIGKMLAKFYTTCYNLIRKAIKRLHRGKNNENNKNG